MLPVGSAPGALNRDSSAVANILRSMSSTSPTASRAAKYNRACLPSTFIMYLPPQSLCLMPQCTLRTQCVVEVATTNVLVYGSSGFELRYCCSVFFSVGRASAPVKAIRRKKSGRGKGVLKTPTTTKSKAKGTIVATDHPPPPKRSWRLQSWANSYYYGPDLGYICGENVRQKRPLYYWNPTITKHVHVQKAFSCFFYCGNDRRCATSHLIYLAFTYIPRDRNKTLCWRRGQQHRLVTFFVQRIRSLAESWADTVWWRSIRGPCEHSFCQ